MSVSTPDVIKALLTELKTLKGRYGQFQARVKIENAAARARDEEARKQNTVLTQRITELEGELNRAKELIEVGLSFLRGWRYNS